jgi:hypothetical protein
MRGWFFFLHWVHDHILFILVGGVVVLFIAAWLVAEALRGTTNKDEIYRLRQRLYQLEREKNFSGMDGGPVVLPSRWIRVGTAATTSDGGCLLLVEAASPVQKRVMMTVRVDGMPVKRSATMMVGQKLRVDGKSGCYSIELFGTEKEQARFAVSLRSRHHADDESET